MKTVLFLIAFLLTIPLWSQPADLPSDENAIPEVVDSLYREDQFYLGLSFNLIVNQPSDFSQNGFSGGLQFGFIRDMPVNQRRNVALGVGLGLSSNTYNSNLFIGESNDNQTVFRIIEDIQDNSDTNRFSTNLVELPIQFRWRTSTPTTFNFWRIYPGFKVGYIYLFRSTFRDGDISVKQTDLPELNRLRYNATLSIGNGSFNAFVNYSLNSLFDQNAVTVDGDEIGLQPIKFGIEFYFL
ncbi:Outer membrane protein beta-barrel domain-containing protein [Nonlabens sp. Hel1_33_55]|uniref:porin family protein n=1 Tax=Nonlabens sp. Hel1_33_55 TaxID=1336802 RepID=UPI000875DC84|nr:porin family protein [Nonlabens sp. Hel1_33_55]SCY27836.1 Outer membrane protein beta-barrel domain-containing protein [Nonlabens sp. Hel1_33_55]